MSLTAVQAKERGMETKWQNVANALWQAVLARAQELKAQGNTLQELANLVGVSSRAVVGAWLTGSRKASGSSFAELMSYAERLGIDYRHYFPGGEPPTQEPATDCATCRKLLAKEKENQKLLQQIEKLRLELAKRDGMVEALERQLDLERKTGRQAETGPAERKMAG